MLLFDLKPCEPKKTFLRTEEVCFSNSFSIYFQTLKKDSVFEELLPLWGEESTEYYPLGFLGEMSTGGPGRGISLGNMSTHICTRPLKTKR